MGLGALRTRKGVPFKRFKRSARGLRSGSIVYGP